MNTNLNLGFRRCPTAMSYSRMHINSAVESDNHIITITTIDPNLPKHIQGYLIQLQPDFEITSTESRCIDDDTIELWESDPFFDEDDMENATAIITLTISRIPK